MSHNRTEQRKKQLPDALTLHLALLFTHMHTFSAHPTMAPRLTPFDRLQVGRCTFASDPMDDGGNVGGAALFESYYRTVSIVAQVFVLLVVVGLDLLGKR